MQIRTFSRILQHIMGLSNETPWVPLKIGREIYHFGPPLGGGGSESMDGWGCAILALELVPKNLTFT